MPYHKILQRQINKFFEGLDVPLNMEKIFQAISDTYQHQDEDRALIERSLELSSKELEELNKQLQSEQIIIENQVEQRTLELKAERNKLAVVLAGISDGVIAVDLQRSVITFNKAAEKLTGLKLTDVLGKPINSVIKVFADGQEITPEQYSPIRTDGFEGVVFNKPDLRFLVNNNKMFHALITSSQITEGKNVNLGSILTIHDTSQEKQLEEMKLDFVSMAAHELRTPLTSIRGYLSVFIKENSKNFTPEQNTFLNRINISTQQLMALIENLLNVSRIERGVLTINITPIDWVEVVKNIVAEMEPRAEERKIFLTFINPPPGIIYVLADQLRIQEVVYNLLANAIAYTNLGGKIEVSIEIKDNMVVTHVKDNGQGIPREAQTHLFTKFFRVSGKLEQGSKGTGLGLYISKAIVNMHKGEIWVESEPGKGSIFSFSLPLANPAPISK